MVCYHESIALIKHVLTPVGITNLLIAQNFILFYELFVVCPAFQLQSEADARVRWSYEYDFLSTSTNSRRCGNMTSAYNFACSAAGFPPPQLKPVRMTGKRKIWWTSFLNYVWYTKRYHLEPPNSDRTGYDFALNILSYAGGIDSEIVIPIEN